MHEPKTSEERLVESINMAEFILMENGDEEWPVNENDSGEWQVACANVNALNSIARSLITLNRLILQGYTQS